MSKNGAFYPLDLPILSILQSCIISTNILQSLILYAILILGRTGWPRGACDLLPFKSLNRTLDGSSTPNSRETCNG